MIPQRTIQEILDTARIEEVIGEFVSLKKAGANFKALSPFTNEKTPSFVVSPAKQIFKCFSTGKGGSVVSFLMEHDQMSYPEALRWLAKKYNIEVEEKQESEDDRQKKNLRESLAVVLEFAAKYFTHQLTETDTGKSIGLSYFKEREIDPHSIQKFRLGYSPDQFDAFTGHALKEGYAKDMLLQAGLSKEKNGKVYDFYKGRVIFPIQNVSGQVVAFAGRTLSSDKKVPKYINSPETELYNKSKTLYGMYQAKNTVVKQDVCYLVEGYTDVISFHQAGVENVVASSGTALTKEQIRLIKRYTSNITILYDGDPAGIKASFRGIDLILENEMNVRVALFPEDEDPDSFARKNGREKLEEFLQKETKDFIGFKSSILFTGIKNDPIKKAEALKELAESLSLIPDHIKRSLFIKETAEQQGMAEEVILQEVNRIRRKKYREQIKKEERSEDFQEDVLPAEQLVKKDRESASEHFDTQNLEKELLRLMLLHGEKTFKLHNLDNENQEIETEHQVLEFILDTLSADEVNFDHNDYHEILQELKENRKTEMGYLLSKMKPELGAILTELVQEKYEMSENWDKKHDIITETEEDKLERVIVQTLYAFLLKKVEKHIKGIQEKIKGMEDIDSALILMEEQSKYEEAKRMFSKELQRIILK